MSDMVDRISNHDDAEKARKENVGAQSKDVFYALFKALEDRVFRYNDRHPQDSGFHKGAPALFNPKIFDNSKEHRTNVIVGPGLSDQFGSHAS
jgi:hypothetical protein